MAKSGRIVIAVIAGAAVWAVLWNLGTAAAQRAFPQALQPDQPITHSGALWGLITSSVVLSLLAGYIAAAVGGRRARPAVWILAALQLALGILFELSYWGLMPVWYHVVFLGLVVPATVMGGMLRAGRRALAPETGDSG